MTYAEEKFHLAIRYSFILGEGDSRERLADAFKYYLYLLREEHMAPDHWKRFKKIRNRLTRKWPIMVGDEVIVGAFDNGQKSIRKATASRLIEELLQIHDEIVELSNS